MNVAIQSIGLEEILTKNDITIIDSCVLIGPMDSRLINKKRNNAEWYDQLKVFFDNVLGLHENVGGLYLTRGVVDEILYNSRFPYKKLLKCRSIQKSKNALNNIQARNKVVKARKRLIRRLESDGTVLVENAEDPVYKLLIHAGKYLRKDFGLSSVDEEFLFAATSRSAEGGNIGMISNDFGILSALNRLNRRAARVGLDIGDGLSYYCSRKIGQFEQLHL